MDSGKLLKESRIRADKIFNVEKNLIIMKIGVASDEIFDRIKKEVKDLEKKYKLKVREVIVH